VILFRILRIIERVGHKMEFAGRTANLTVAKLALAVLRVDHKFEGMAFSIQSSEEVIAPQVSATQETESQATKWCPRSSPMKFLGRKKCPLEAFNLNGNIRKYRDPRGKPLVG
jgi:hypothetical protein